MLPKKMLFLDFFKYCFVLLKKFRRNFEPLIKVTLTMGQCPPNLPASEARREVENLKERKNLHTTVYGVKEFVCLFIHLLLTLTPIISGMAKQFTST